MDNFKILAVNPQYKRIFLSNPTNIKVSAGDSLTKNKKIMYCKGIDTIDYYKIKEIDPEAKPTPIILTGGNMRIDNDATLVEFIEAQNGFGKPNKNGEIEKRCTFRWFVADEQEKKLNQDFEDRYETIDFIRKSKEFELRLIAFNSGLFTFKQVTDSSFNSLRTKIFLRAEQNHTLFKDAIDKVNAKEISGSYFTACLFLKKIIVQNPDNWIYQTSNNSKLCFVPIGVDVVDTFMSFQSNKEHHSIIQGLRLQLKDAFNKERKMGAKKEEDEKKLEKINNSLEDEFPKFRGVASASIQNLLKYKFTLESIATNSKEVFLESIKHYEKETKNPMAVLPQTIDRSDFYDACVSRYKEIKRLKGITEEENTEEENFELEDGFLN